MSREPSPEELEAIAAHYAALWRVLSHDGAGPRPLGETLLLADRVRDALDRRLARLEPAQAAFIADSFVEEALVHEGALYAIHRIRQRDLGTLHALKVLRADQADNVVARDLLLREAVFGARLRHPHIAAATLALRLPDGRPAVVMDWLPGRLSERMQAGSFTPDEILTIIRNLLLALSAVHEAGLVHADVAPDNLLHDGTDLATLRLADFGIALEIGQRHDAADLAKAGRDAFSAPEQRAGQALDGRTDLYACGRLLMVLLDRCFAPEATIAPLTQLAAQLTQPEPGKRPQSAAIALALIQKAIPPLPGRERGQG
ncbi:protein kinase domain-containing protein [Labrys neptuniae]